VVRKEMGFTRNCLLENGYAPAAAHALMRGKVIQKRLVCLPHLAMKPLTTKPPPATAVCLTAETASVKS